MKWFILKLFAIFFTIINFVFSQKCSIGLDCQATFCCKNSKCVESEICKRDMNIVYIVVGCTAIFLLILTIIYYIYSRNETIESMKKYNEANQKTKSIKIDPSNDNKDNIK